LAPARVSAKETWLSVRSKNFFVIGNAGEGEMRKVAARLELFRYTIARLFPRIKIDTPIPTTVVLFKNDNSFHPFKPRYKGKIQDQVAGYFFATPDINYIALTADAHTENPYEVIFHEYEHFIIDNNLRHAPVWLSEGLAEYFSTFETSDGDQKVRLGRPMAYHVHNLRAASLLPLATLLTVDHKSPHYNESSKATIFYAESWALVDYLMLGKGGQRQPQLNRFISQLNSELSLEENFRQSFQTDYKGMEAELRAYISKFLFPAVEYTFTAPLAVAKEAQSATLTEAEVQYHLGDLLLHSNRLDEAEEHLQKSVALDAHFAPSQVALGILRLRQRRLPEARQQLQAALALDPRNYLGHFYYAQTLSLNDQSDEAIKSLQEAVTLKPDLAQLQEALGYAYLNAGREADALDAFKQAINLAPNHSHIYRTRGYAYLRLERWRPATIDALSYLQLEGWRDEHAPYMALVAHFGYRQGKQLAAADKMLAEAVAKADPTAWPYPVLKYLQHASTAPELIAQAKDNDQLTEAHAYIGLDLSLSGDREGALTHLRWVKENGNKNFVEYPLALAEIDRLEGQPASPVK
jgi:tetratricopeptide (TPR) repeat protein